MPSRGSRMPAAATNCGDTEDLASHVLQRPARSLNSVRSLVIPQLCCLDYAVQEGRLNPLADIAPPPPPPEPQMPCTTRASSVRLISPRAALLNPKANRGKRMLDAPRTRCEVTSGGVSVGWWIGCGFSARDRHAPSRGPPLGCECDERKKAAGNGSDRIYNDCKSIHNYQKIIYNASDRIYNYQKIIYKASDRIYNYQKIIYKALDRIYNYQKIIYEASDRIYNARKTSTEDLQ
ncbi:hypothetical protein DFH11DRAFT_1745069 [Phellopilus nigrolimitatus]|nr:hypothetical protein DFH11DRAFT_1745069 [Phellopilus nigrolimitatus]